MFELLADNNFGDTRSGSLAGPTGSGDHSPARDRHGAAHPQHELAAAKAAGEVPHRSNSTRANAGGQGFRLSGYPAQFSGACQSVL